MSGIKQKKETNKTLLVLTGLLLIIVSIGIVAQEAEELRQASTENAARILDLENHVNQLESEVEEKTANIEELERLRNRLDAETEAKRQAEEQVGIVAQEASREAAGRMALSTGTSMVIKNLQNGTDVTATVANTGATSLPTFTMYIGTNSAQNTTVTIAEGGTGTMQFENMGKYITTGVTQIKIVASEGATATYQYVA